MSDLIDDLRGHTHHPDRRHPCYRCDAADEIIKLRALVKMGEAVVDDFMPNIAKCALQDYGRVNDFLNQAEKIEGSKS